MNLRVIAGASVVVASVSGAGFALGDGDDDDVLGPGQITVELGIEHSAFDTDVIRVREGTSVRFVVVNGDPIRHELIVGPRDVHDRHENGTEAAHAPRPGEVTVDALDRAATTYVFDEPGRVEFACHLPGHLAYGMAGTVEVVPA